LAPRPARRAIMRRSDVPQTLPRTTNIAWSPIPPALILQCHFLLALHHRIRHSSFALPARISLHCPFHIVHSVHVCIKTNLVCSSTNDSPGLRYLSNGPRVRSGHLLHLQLSQDPTYQSTSSHTVLPHASEADGCLPIYDDERAFSLSQHTT